jgi:hypothetical protein
VGNKLIEKWATHWCTKHNYFIFFQLFISTLFCQVSFSGYSVLPWEDSVTFWISFDVTNFVKSSLKFNPVQIKAPSSLPLPKASNTFRVLE